MIEAFGERVRGLRAEFTLSQAQLAKKIGVSSSMVAMYELGSRLPSFETLLQIRKVFGVTTDFLLGVADSDTRAIDITGLTDGQIQAVYNVVEQFREANHRG